MYSQCVFNIEFVFHITLLPISGTVRVFLFRFIASKKGKYNKKKFKISQLSCSKFQKRNIFNSREIIALLTKMTFELHDKERLSIKLKA